MSTNVYYIDIDREKRNTAGAKAPQDISELCGRLGMKKFRMPLFPSKQNFIYQKLWLLVVCSFYWIKLERTLPPGSVVLYQHPMYGTRVAERFIPWVQKRKNCKFIAFIHDLESLRKGIDGALKYNKKTSEISDNDLLKHFDLVICHNRRMKKYLMHQGFDSNRLIELGIFDYLCECNPIKTVRNNNPSIAIAGNLTIGKCFYVYNLHGDDGSKNRALEVNLYGNNYNKEAGSQEKLIYHGSFSPEELPQKLKGDFGLVWDGNSAETCAGNTGEYLKYNNPHKTSLYLAAGMPIITWSQAAIADFVLDQDVGIVIDSLYELEDAINKISDDEYQGMRENAIEIGEKIRGGYFFEEALKKCFQFPLI